jgi:hypothetical protein
MYLLVFYILSVSNSIGIKHFFLSKLYMYFLSIHPANTLKSQHINTNSVYTNKSQNIKIFLSLWRNIQKYYIEVNFIID